MVRKAAPDDAKAERAGVDARPTRHDGDPAVVVAFNYSRLKPDRTNSSSQFVMPD
jgi:hypothetical protein